MGLVALEVTSITSASVLARNLESSLRLTALAVGAIGGFALWWQWWPKSVPASTGRHRVLCRAFNPLDGERCHNRAVRGYEGLCYDHYLEAMASGIE